MCIRDRNYYKEVNILENVNKSGKVLGDVLEAIKVSHKCVGDVRYIGLFSAVELVKSKDTREPLVPYNKDPDVYKRHVYEQSRHARNYVGLFESAL